MALWKDSPTGTSPAPTNTPGMNPAQHHPREPERTNVASLAPEAPRRAAPAPAPAPRVEHKESHIAADLTIEGKIVGSGHIRIAGRVKGNVVSVGGELIGNIENAKRVELLETGVINGDVKAGQLTVAAGSRMRGQVEFGYEGETRAKGETKGFGNA